MRTIASLQLPTDIRPTTTTPNSTSKHHLKYTQLKNTVFLSQIQFTTEQTLKVIMKPIEVPTSTLRVTL